MDFVSLYLNSEKKMISKCYGKVNKRQALDLNLSRKLIRRLIGWLATIQLIKILNVMVTGLLFLQQELCMITRGPLDGPLVCLLHIDLAWVVSSPSLLL